MPTIEVSLALVPASHDDILRVLVSLALLLVVARALAELATRVGQPPVVGEILAGLILGPSLLSGAFPRLGEWIVPQSVVAGNMIEFVGMLGAMFLLIITGIETDIPLIRRNARTAIGVAAGGLIVPFTLGFVVAQYIPEDLVGDPTMRHVFALFLATAMAVSAIPVVAKVLLDLGLIRRKFGQTVLAAGMIDDTVAWVMLSLVLALAAGNETALGTVFSAARILVFLGLAATLGRFLINRVLAVVQDRGRSPDRVFTTVVATALAFGALAQALGIEALLGAFVAGIIFGQNPRLPLEVIRRLHTMALAVFAPIFFAIAGLKVDIGALREPRLIALSLLILGVAISGKMLGAYVGARLVGVDSWTAAAYGSALNARGAVEIIIASIGLSLGILSVELYSMVVLTAVVTSVMTPGLVRFFLSKVPSDPADDLRAGRELAEQTGFRKPRRILIPVRVRSSVAPVHHVTADIVGRVGRSAAVTLMSVVAREEKQQAYMFLRGLSTLFRVKPTIRVSASKDPVATILDTATTDFDFMILGAHEPANEHDTLFSPVVDALVRLSPCPTLIVTGLAVDPSNWPPTRILVPTDGTPASRRSAQMAFAFAGEAQISLLHIVRRSEYARLEASSQGFLTQMSQAQEILDDTAELALAYGLTVTKRVVTSPLVADAIIQQASEMEADLIVLGTSLRPGSIRLYLGPQVETILQRSPCPVLLLNSP
jgi:Kef-type K+ transport system membrane component KefB